MSAITDQFDAAFSDYNTDGVPASGIADVKKTAARAIGPIIDAALASLGLGTMLSVTYSTRAALNADLAHAANSVALVYADSTDANNDLYVKVGSSGSGSWTLTSALHGIIAALAQPYVDAAGDARDEALAAVSLTKRQAVLGYQTDGVVPDGTNDTPSSTEFALWGFMPYSGTIKRIRGYFGHTGNLTIGRRTSDRGALPTMTKVDATVVAIGSTGAQSISTAITFEAGEMLTAMGSATGLIRYATTLANATPYYQGTGSGTATLVATSYQFGTALSIAFDVEFDVPATFGGEITLANSDRIVICGDSIGGSSYSLRRKGWVHRLSAESDYAFENFSLSGDDTSKILARIQSNATTYGLPFRDYGAEYAIDISGVNDGGTTDPGGAATYDFPTFIEETRLLAQTLRAYGCRMIFATELLDVYGANVIAPAMKQFAQQYDGYFVNLRTLGRKYGYGGATAPGYYAGFWSYVHPGQRSVELFKIGMAEQLKQLPRPKQSIKVFTPWTTPGAVTDLAFDTLDERKGIWSELQMGENALTTGTEKFLDEINSGSAGTSLLSSDLITLMRGAQVAVTDYVLFDIILPCNAAALDRVEILLGDATLSAWILGVNTSATSGSKCRVPVAMTLDADGTIALSKAGLKGMVREDRISVIVYKSSAWQLSQPRVRWWGVEGKPLRANGYLPKATGAQLLTQTLVGQASELASWTIAGTVTGATPTDLPPLGTTKVATVSDVNTLTQALSLGALSATDDTEVEVEVAARYFPALVSSGAAYPGSASINETSIDFKTLKLALTFTSGGNSYSVPYTATVGLWWTPVRFRSIIPYGSTDVKLTIATTAGNLQIATASVKVATS